MWNAVKFKRTWHVPWSSHVERSPGWGCDSFPQRRFQVGMRSWAPGSHEFWVEPWSERGEPERGRRPSAGIERLPLLANSRNRRVFPCICVSLCHEECHRCVSECQWKYRRGCGCVRVPAPRGPVSGATECAHTTTSCNTILYLLRGWRQGGAGWRGAALGPLII